MRRRDTHARDRNGGNVTLVLGDQHDKDRRDGHHSKPYSKRGALSYCVAFAITWNGVSRGTSEEEVLAKAAEHAKTVHNLTEIPEGMLSQVRGAIGDDEQAGAQNAGAQTQSEGCPVPKSFV